MEYVKIKDYKISKLTLGTVALGLDYGIANSKGKPSQEASFDILSSAVEAGINTLDTARTYGDAEQKIGDFFQQRGGLEEVNIVTKFKLNAAHIGDPSKARDEVFDSVNASLAQLKCKKIPICLLHMDRELPLEEKIDPVLDIFRDLKKEGLIDIAGISINHPDEADLLLAYPEIEALQIPINIFDHRLINNGTLQRIANKNKIVFARSVFLQGLFFLSENDLKGNLVNAGLHLRKLKEIATIAEMSIAELAFSYIRGLEGITSIVFGADNPEQIKQNVDLLNVKPLDAELNSMISDSFAEIDEELLTPSLWYK